VFFRLPNHMKFFPENLLIVLSLNILGQTEIKGECMSYRRRGEEGKALRDDRFRAYFDFITR
jgi:hypothetical protein